VQLALRGGGPDNITVVVADATDADIMEQAPIVGGAAARDRGNTTVADSSSAAARAAALQSPPRPAQPEGGAYEAPEPEPKRHPVRTSLLLLLLLAVLGGGLFLGWRYTQDQYYVGATDSGQLAIFQGVPGEVAGFDLSSVNETSNARLDDLTTTAQERVKQGIQADNRPDAQRRLAELTSDQPTNPNLKPICAVGPSTSASAPANAPSTPPVAPSAAGDPSASGRNPASSAPASAPVTTPDAQPSDAAPPVIPPVGCRPVD
jgi:protein phosphatase